MELDDHVDDGGSKKARWNGYGGVVTTSARRGSAALDQRLQEDYLSSRKQLPKCCFGLLRADCRSSPLKACHTLALLQKKKNRAISCPPSSKTASYHYSTPGSSILIALLPTQEPHSQ